MSWRYFTSAAFMTGLGTAVAASPGESVLACSPGRPGARTGAVESARGADGGSAVQPDRAMTVPVTTTMSAARTQPP